MKNTDKKNVFTLAWQFARQTGLSFSECLKKAWANIKLKAKMCSQIVRFYFLKVDGSTREAWGTLRPDLLPQTEISQCKSNNTVQVYFDTECHEFRCFKKFNLVSIA
ncbi:SH3 beta-barrel fold-containing protein [Capnocytophaga sputigena]|uniref:SH3 beta-barrel fold-containing protein n=1 Tax=Capnocytophaga sputigena TaxID=1019 RepID=UPI00288C3BB2|nr:SH3 beta-barrel fold-containing protein [Capnocytophaga sputigena]